MILGARSLQHRCRVPRTELSSHEHAGRAARATRGSSSVGWPRAPCARTRHPRHSAIAPCLAGHARRAGHTPRGLARGGAPPTRALPSLVHSRHPFSTVRAQILESPSFFPSLAELSLSPYWLLSGLIRASPDPVADITATPLSSEIASGCMSNCATPDNIGF